MYRLLFLLFIFPFEAVGQQAFKPETVKEIKADASFRYQAPVIREPTALEIWWEGVKEYIADLLRPIGKVAFQHPVSKWVWIALALGILIFLAYKRDWLSLSRKEGTKKRRKSIVPQQLQIDDEDLEYLLRKAVEQEDFKSATRYLYIKSLKMLSLRAVIDFQQWEIHSQIAKQIPQLDLKQSFNDLGYFFQYVCYGDYEADRNTYQTALEVYVEFERKLKK
ncbi:hypothetical protein [Persicobacter diffluens]|uniref:DUF4129 domain-containing protein n=1 Tax=Persicobacter diffluens TaxID=981 RepID=A0AAN5AKJ9_9BACT|nr:hypothetical protein PEDI_24390 [Persicobacter diffluens]